MSQVTSRHVFQLALDKTEILPLRARQRAISRFDVPGNFWSCYSISLFSFDKKGIGTSKSQAQNEIYLLAISRFDVPGKFFSPDH